MATSKKKPAAKSAKPAKTSKPGKRSAAAGYAWRSTLNMGVDLDDARFTTVEEGDAATFLFSGEPYAQVRLDGDQLEVDVRSPQELGPFEKVLRHYQRLSAPAGWLRLRCPATRDPRPWLDADFGGLLGAVMRDVSRAADAGKLRSVLSAGGPYVVMGSSQRVRWWGATEGKAAYEALRGPDEGYVVDAAGGKALVLGTPDEVTWLELPEGGVLVRIVSLDASDSAKVRELCARIPADGWSAIAERFEVAEPLRCFDAALSGGSVGDAESLELKLKPGPYRIESRTWEPDGAELLLTRFARS
jgi:hypothetical protein